MYAFEPGDSWLDDWFDDWDEDEEEPGELAEVPDEDEEWSWE